VNKHTDETVAVGLIRGSIEVCAQPLLQKIGRINKPTHYIHNN